MIDVAELVEVSFIEKDLTSTQNTENETPPQTPIGSKKSYPNENAWDSSPSTVAPDEEEEEVNSHSISHVEITNEINPGYDNQSKYVDDDDENDSDLELTQRSRQIQLDLRLREMSELAIEAERAAAAGEDSFKGNATRFELGLGLDVDVSLPPPTAPNAIRSKRWKHNQKASSKRRLWNEECDPFYCSDRSKVNVPPSPTELWVFPKESPASTAAKRQNRVLKSSTLEFSSSHKSPRTISVSSMTSHFPHVIHSRRFLTTPLQEIDKIPVLHLRHINDVIPCFKDMQSFLKMHLSRTGASDFHHTLKVENELPSSSRNISRHISGFQQILRSFSSNSYKQRELTYKDNHSLKEDAMSFESNDGDESSTSTDVSKEDFTQSEMYVNTLSSETYDPKMNLRTNSPLPLSPYNDDENDDNVIVYFRSPSSAWTNFWVNMSPVKKSNVEASPTRRFSLTETTPSKPFLLTPIARRKSQLADSLLMQAGSVTLKSLSNDYDDIEVQGDILNDKVKLTVNSSNNLILRDGYSLSSNKTPNITKKSVSHVEEERYSEPIHDMKVTCSSSMPSQNHKNESVQKPLNQNDEWNCDHPVPSAPYSTICSPEQNCEVINPNRSTSQGTADDDLDHEVSSHTSQQAFRGDSFDSKNIKKTEEIGVESKENDGYPVMTSIQAPITRSLSFLNLMVEKVPSVIGGFNPLRKSKKSKASFFDDISFMENYLYTGIGQRNRDSFKLNTPRRKTSRLFCGIQINCFEVGCDSMLDSLKCFNEKMNEQQIELQSNASFMEPTSKFASIQRDDEPKKILFGNKMFQPPLLKVHQYRDKLTDISEDEEISIFDE